MKAISLLLALAGLVLATALVAWFGFTQVLEASLALGWGGFLVLCLWQGVLFIMLAAAWMTIVPGGKGVHAYSTYLWGRMVRDSAGNCLPFTHMGGFVAGARAVSLRGITPVQATASTVADVTAEVLAQLGFAAIGLVILVAYAPHSEFAVPVAIGLAIALPALAGFIAMQQGAGVLFARLSRHIVGDWLANARERAQILTAEFALIYGHMPRVAACVLLHLLAWIGTGIGGWITLRLLGAEVNILQAIAIEGLLHAVLATAFLVPGHAGVQEAAYIGLGAAFGVSPEVALAASLTRRARDLAVGIPVLLVWQGLEWRWLRRR
jgi:putative membrane protein